MNLLLTLPIAIPLATAAVCLAVGRRIAWHRRIGGAGAVLHLAVSVWLLLAVRGRGILVSEMGSWPAPFGITLVADLFSAIMVVLTGLMGLTVFVYSLEAIDHQRERFGYHPLMHVLLMGVSGSFLTGDLFNLYVWFEVMLISSFALLALGGEPRQIEGSIKYVTLNLVASALLLSGIGLVYGLTGTLNMADLSMRLHDTAGPSLVTVLAMLFLAAFGTKAAIFPLFFWLPASYHTPPVAVSAIFAALLTKVGVYAMIRVFTLIFVRDTAYTHGLLLVLAGLTMVTGVLGAIAQNDWRRLLSFHIISQIGYMIMGLALFTPLALAGSIYFIVHNIFAKTNLFLVSGLAYRSTGTYDLRRLGGLYRTRPALAMLFLISALSLAGVPPLSGFAGKLLLVQAGLQVEGYAIVAIALGVSLLTLYSMNKIWTEAFWKPPPEPDSPAAGGGARVVAMWLPAVALAFLTIAMGVAAQPAFALVYGAAEQLTDPRAYIEAVMGVRQ